MTRLVLMQNTLCSGKRPSAGLTEEEKVRLFPIFFCFYLDNSGPVVLW